MNNILEILHSIRPEVDFSTSTNFIVDGFLDSLDVVTLVSELDNRFAISIDGMDIVPENFASLQSIQKLLQKNGVEI